MIEIANLEEWTKEYFSDPENQKKAEKACAITVASAAPATPQLKPATKTRSSTTLIKAAIIIAINGVLLFPSARNTDAKIL